MHEMSITQSLLEVALAEAAKSGAKRITAINIKIGALTGVVEESVAMYLGFLAKDTPAEGARFHRHAVTATRTDITFLWRTWSVCPRWRHGTGGHRRGCS